MGQAYGFVSKGTLSSIYGAVIDLPKNEKAANNDPYCLNPLDARYNMDNYLSQRRYIYIYTHMERASCVPIMTGSALAGHPLVVLMLGAALSWMSPLCPLRGAKYHIIRVLSPILPLPSIASSRAHGTALQAALP